MKRERHYLELLVLLGLVGLVAFLLSWVVVVSGSAVEAGFVIQLFSSLAIAVGGGALLGLLVVDRIVVRQDEILRQLDELKAAQKKLNSDQVEPTAPTPPGSPEAH